MGGGRGVIRWFKGSCGLESASLQLRESLLRRRQGFEFPWGYISAMQRRTLVYLAAIGAVVACLESCTWKPSVTSLMSAAVGPIQLPSGSRVVVSHVGPMWFRTGPPALSVKHDTSLDPISDFDKLHREANELFKVEHKVIADSQLQVVILMANHKVGGSLISTARGYDFVYHQQGKNWCEFQRDRSCVPIQ